MTQRPEAMVEKTKRRRTPPRSASEVGSEGLSAEPELSQQMREEVQRHFENWIFQKVPALGGRTPLEVVADPEGKEIVRQTEKMSSPGVFHPDISAIRRLLQLTPSP